MDPAPQVDEVVGQAAPSAMATERLEAELVTWAARLAAGMAHWLAVLAEYDRRAGYQAWGCATAVRWLSWQCGLDPRAAREHLRVARALEVLPTVQAAMASGELSFSRVRAITRVAVEATEEQWVEVARHSTAAQLERAVRATPPGTDRGQCRSHPRRPVAPLDLDDDGSLIIRGRLPADAGAALIATLAVLEAEAPAPEPECDDPLAARRADALVALIEGRADDGERNGAPPAAVHVVVHTTPAGSDWVEGAALVGWSSDRGHHGPAAGLRCHRRRGRRARLGVASHPAGAWSTAAPAPHPGPGLPVAGLRVAGAPARPPRPPLGPRRRHPARQPRAAVRPPPPPGPRRRLRAGLRGERRVGHPAGRPPARAAGRVAPSGMLPPARQPPANGWDGSALGLHDLVEGVLLLEAAAS